MFKKCIFNNIKVLVVLLSIPLFTMCENADKPQDQKTLKGEQKTEKKSTELPKRPEIDAQYKWDLTDIFPNDEAWQKEFESVKSELTEFDSFKGKVGTSAENLIKTLKTQTELESRFSKLYLYASLAKDRDLNVGKYQTMFGKVQKLGADYSAATAFINPELLEIPGGTIKAYINANAQLKEYEKALDDILRNKEHMLSASQEKLMAQLQPVEAIPRNTYVILNDAELPFPTIKDEDGNDVKISHGRYRAGLYSQDRSYRERVYKGIYKPYGELKATLATLFNGRVKTRVINSQIRKYESPLEMALSRDNIPVSVYENLVKSVNENVKSLHRWAELKRKVLGYDKLHPYDSYVSLFPGVSKEYTVEEAKELLLKALAPLGEEYIKVLKEGFDNRWIDFYENEGKRSGAYSNSSGAGPHPFILMNWNNTLDDVFTLAHELGHNMHSYFTEQEQPFQYAGYSIFVAEIASITNEALLLDYLLENADTKEMKMALIEKFLTNAQMTFFRQTRFAEFEKVIHEKALKDEILTADQLTKEFGDMYTKYWGDAMEMDAQEGLSWARIPHLFKYDFYVFQYATGFAAAQAISEKIKEEGQPAIDKFLDFLKAGDSDYPINVLSKTGVNMNKPEAIDKTIAKINNYIDDLEQLLNE